MNTGAQVKVLSERKTLMRIFIWSVAFLTPLLLQGPQWLVGTIVNTCLVIGAIRFNKKKIIPLVILPSIGALGHGVLFGPLTVFLIYFMPFIWLGNLALVKVISELRQKMNPEIGLFMGAGIKAIILFTAANAYVGLKIVPSKFLVAMGWIQLGTALLGGGLALLILKWGWIDERGKNFN